MKTLTVEAARSLKGKRIKVSHTDSFGQTIKDEFIVGDVLSEYDAMLLDDVNRPILKERWDAFLAEGKYRRLLTTMYLMTEDNRNTYFYFEEGDGYFQSRGECNPVMYEL